MNIPVRAKKEIILTGGAIETPKLLMLSGIGPNEELDKHRVRSSMKRDLPLSVLCFCLFISLAFSLYERVVALFDFLLFTFSRPTTFFLLLLLSPIVLYVIVLYISFLFSISIHSYYHC